jgi:hypothetical protein
VLFHVKIKLGYLLSYPASQQEFSLSIRHEECIDIFFEEGVFTRRQAQILLNRKDVCFEENRKL